MGHSWLCQDSVMIQWHTTGSWHLSRDTIVCGMVDEFVWFENLGKQANQPITLFLQEMRWDLPEWLSDHCSSYNSLNYNQKCFWPPWNLVLGLLRLFLYFLISWRALMIKVHMCGYLNMAWFLQLKRAWQNPLKGPKNIYCGFLEGRYQVLPYILNMWIQPTYD